MPLTENESIELINYELENTISHFSALSDILETLIYIHDREELFGSILKKLNNYFNFSKGLFVKRDDKEELFKVLSSYGFSEGTEFKAIERRSNSIVWCMNDINSSMVIHDSLLDKRFENNEFFENEKSYSIITSCLGENPVYGIFIFYFEKQSISFLRSSLNRFEDLMTIVQPHFLHRLESSENIRKLIEATSSRNYFNNIFKSMNELLFVVDTSGKIRTINKETLDSLNYARDELIGKSIDSIFVSGKAPDISEGTHIETRLKNKDGDEIFFSISGAKMFDSEGNFQGMIFLARDIMKEKKSEREKIEMQNKIFQSSKLASLGTLVAGIAHEINNPLTILIGYIEMLLDKTIKNRFDRKNFKQILEIQMNTCQRINEIIYGLKLYARSDMENEEILDLNEIIRTTILPLKNIYRNKGIEIVKNLSNVPFHVRGNRGKIQQVIMNLVSNASDSFDEKGGEITLETLSDAKKVIFRVSDNGTGIPTENQNKIFDAFYTTKQPGKGTGLGLSICHSIIHDMNGSIDFFSEEGKGTTFTLSFPITGETTLSAEEIESEDIKESSFRGRILVVDDEEHIRFILQSNLSDLGFTVDLANDGLIAIEKIKRNKYDYIITDLKMPNVRGEEIIEEVVNNKISDAKIYITSGSFSRTEGNKIIKRADGFIKKPFTKKDILKIFNK